MPRWNIVKALVRRDVAAYFSNPTGYVFIVLFVLAGAIAAFAQPEFFAANLCNLDQLTAYLPLLLLFFVPAITMGTWAEERRQGTEELLLTLPATELELVLGKYLAAVCNYGIALGFSLTHIFVLMLLGSPDWGLLLATYFGYFILGASLIAFGMIGSLVAGSTTVAFIYGAMICGVAIGFEQGGRLLSNPGSGWYRFFVEGSVLFPFREAANGVVTMQALVTTGATIGVMVFLSVVILAARRRGVVSPHGPIRFVAAGGIGLFLSILASRPAVRMDMTAEQVNALSVQTKQVLGELDPKQPVYVRAFISSDVPQEYVGLRKKLMGKLREYEARAGGAIVLEVRTTDPYSDEAKEAEEHYGIQAQEIPTERGGTMIRLPVYLGVALTSGAERAVIPFMHRRFSPEYELTRAIRVVSRAKRPRLGVLVTGAKILGGFNFQAMRQNPEWSIVTELKQQYDVVEVSADADYPKDLDALLAIAPSSLEQAPLDRFADYVATGAPVIVVEDPLPYMNPALSPSEPTIGERSNPFGGGPPPKRKGDFDKFLARVGVRFRSAEVVWDAHNPHPRLGQVPRHFVFVGPGNGAKHPVNPDEPVTAGLQEVLGLWPGHVEAGHNAVTITPLLTSGGESGVHRHQELVRRSPFGGFGGLMQPRGYYKTTRAYVLAAYARGELPAGTAGQAGAKVNLAFICDIDMISETFFNFRRDGPKDLSFDNVTFILNVIDAMAKDESFIDLRKRRVAHRRLESIERQVREFEKTYDKQEEEANGNADTELSERQAQLNEAVNKIRERQDLDPQAKSIMIQQAQETENRKLSVAKTQIETSKKRKIYLARTELEEKRRTAQNRVRAVAVIIPPIPALLLALLLWGVRRAREQEVTR